MRNGGRSFLAVVFLSVGFVGSAEAGTFVDDFSNSTASPFWTDEFGGWVANDRGYGATVVDATDFPSARSSLPWVLDDFTLELKINNVKDGGVWLRSTDAPGSTLGRTGVVLVTGGFGGTGTGLYWHETPADGARQAPNYDGVFQRVDDLFKPGDDPNIRIVVSGNTYSAYVNGAFATKYETNLFPTGQVALFDSGPGQALENPGQTFDDVRLVAPQIVLQQVVVPEPATYVLLLAPAIIVLGSRIFARR